MNRCIAVLTAALAMVTCVVVYASPNCPYNATFASVKDGGCVNIPSGQECVNDTESPEAACNSGNTYHTCTLPDTVTLQNYSTQSSMPDMDCQAADGCAKTNTTMGPQADTTPCSG